MIDRLTNNLDDEDKELIEELDWYFVAVQNPDGYNFSIYQDRLWRKTRCMRFQKDDDDIFL